MLSRKLSRIFYGGFWTHVSSSKPMERKTRRARLAAISSIVFTVKRLVKRQYLLVQTTACNWSESTWSLFLVWGIFTWTSLNDHRNICSSKKPRIAVKFYEHFDWVNTSSIWRKWRPTESDVRHKSKGWKKERRRSKCRSVINFHKNEKNNNNEVDSKKYATTACVHDAYWPFTLSNHKYEAHTVLLVVKFGLNWKF